MNSASVRVPGLRQKAPDVLDQRDGLAGLTSKQESFVSYCFSGMNDAEAYRAAYDCSGMQDTTIHQRAHELTKNGKVAARLRELRDKRDEQSILASNLTREWITQGLMKLAAKATKESVQLGAYTQLGKIVGIDLFRETTRVEKVERTQADIDRELEQYLSELTPVIEGKAVETPDHNRVIKPARRRKGE